MFLADPHAEVASGGSDVCKPALRAVELYAGAGGMSLGMQRAGIQVTRAYDHAECAVDAYNRNLGYPAHAVKADLSDVSSFALEVACLEPEVVIGGPPCQDFSPAGARHEGERANHTKLFALYVCTAMPEWFLMENVQRARGSKAWETARELLKRAGYGLTEVVLNAAYYGVPQSRKRFIVVGRRGERDGFLEQALRKAASKQPMPLRELFGDRLGDHFYSHPRAPDRRGVWSVDAPHPTIRNARRPQPKAYAPHRNDSNYQAAVCLRPYPEGREVYAPDEPDPSIPPTLREQTSDSCLANSHYTDPLPSSRATVLSQAEISLIQGFPEDWDWSASTVRDADQMIANAVPAPMAERIGNVIVARHRGETCCEVPGNYRQWLSREKGMSKQRVANAVWRVKKAWSLLGGRNFACRGRETRELELAMQQAGYPGGKQSDLRIALREFRDWEDAQKRNRTARTQTPLVKGSG
jgi:DNA (cytosine-5)-methyltransferase 1